MTTKNKSCLYADHETYSADMRLFKRDYINSKPFSRAFYPVTHLQPLAGTTRICMEAILSELIGELCGD